MNASEEQEPVENDAPADAPAEQADHEPQIAQNTSDESAGTSEPPIPFDSNAPTMHVGDDGTASQSGEAPNREQPTIHSPLPTQIGGVDAQVPIGDFLLGVPPELASHPRYRPLEMLGQGGMGTVYKASHRVMERIVALKVIRPELTRDDLVERFRREIRAAAKLSHPNIVIAHDAEQAGDIHFLVVEYVDGASLDRLIEKEGPMPVRRACQMLQQAADGLQHAFEKGMVHRDIKPQNLMCTTDGTVKILDFGLALVYSDASATSALTHGGGVMGTPDYIAPEQADDAHAADIRSDVYSLGCTLYFLLRGKPPFAEGSIVQKLMAHVEKQPPNLREIRDDVPEELCSVIRKAMAKKPEDRYQSPAELSTALKPFAEGAILPTLVAGTVETPSSKPVSKPPSQIDSQIPNADSAVSSADTGSRPASGTSEKPPISLAGVGSVDSRANQPASQGSSSNAMDASDSSASTSGSAYEEPETELVAAELIEDDDTDDRPARYSHQYTQPTPKPHTSFAGKFALFFGLMTIMMAWVPFVGVAMLPFSVLGMVIAVFSIVLSWGNPESSIRIQIIAAILCSISIALSSLSTMWWTRF